jgi:hypothetical protein
MKIILFFGAGASFGSGGCNRIPPLATTLYKELQDSFPNSWGAADPALNEIFEKNFELGMNELCKDDTNLSPLDSAQMVREMAAYFSSLKIENLELNLYYRLFKKYRDELLNQNITIATLNYDLLIDQALISLGIDIDHHVEHYTKIYAATLFKPHGACNFLLNGFIVSGQNARLIMGNGGRVNGHISIEYEESLKNSLNEKFPVMSYFTPDKVTKFGEPHIERIRHEFTKKIYQAKSIITVGIKPNISDKHIWDPLTLSGHELSIISAEEEFGSYIEETNRNSTCYLGSKFDDCFNSICEKIDQNINAFRNKRNITLP